MDDERESIDTLVSIAGTLAGVSLALVGILAAKSSMDKTQTIADDLFLFSSLGFLIVVALGYFARKQRAERRAARFAVGAETVLSVSMIGLLVGAFVLVYTEL